MSAQSYVSKFLLVALFVCAVGMICATAVTLKDDISDRCLLIPHDGNANAPLKMRNISHDAVVSGGFGVTASLFAFLSLICLMVCNDVAAGRKALYGVLLFLAGCGFAVVGGIQLSRVQDPEARCGRQNSDGDFKLPDIEIASTIVSGLTIVGLLTPVLETWFSR